MNFLTTHIDKISIIFFAAIGITLILVLNSWYVKSCVRTEIDDIRKDTRKRKQINEELQKRQFDVPERDVEVPQEVEQVEDDMDSYVDPVGKDINEHNYQDVNNQYKSRELENDIDDHKNNILMRDIMDNKGMENRRH